MLRTMSRSCAPCLSTRVASSRLELERVAPRGKPRTTPTGMPVPVRAVAASETQEGLTMAQAKRCSAASWQSWRAWVRAAPGRGSGGSRRAAGFCAEERAWAVKAGASKRSGPLGRGSEMVRVLKSLLLRRGGGRPGYFLSYRGMNWLKRYLWRGYPGVPQVPLIWIFELLQKRWLSAGSLTAIFDPTLSAAITGDHRRRRDRRRQHGHLRRP